MSYRLALLPWCRRIRQVGYRPLLCHSVYHLSLRHHLSLSFLRMVRKAVRRVRQRGGPQMSSVYVNLLETCTCSTSTVYQVIAYLISIQWTEKSLFFERSSHRANRRELRFLQSYVMLTSCSKEDWVLYGRRHQEYVALYGSTVAVASY